MKKVKMLLSNPHKFIVLLALMAATCTPHLVQAAELKYYYEMVDRESLPEDVESYISRQSDCQVMSEQDYPRDEDQKKALQNMKCEMLECDRKKLYEKYQDTPMKEVIANYNSSLWKMQFPSDYSANACDVSPKNGK